MAEPTFIDVPVMSAAVGNAASNAARDLGRGVSDLGSDASGNAQSALDSVKDAASDVAGNIKDAARQVCMHAVSSSCTHCFALIQSQFHSIALISLYRIEQFACALCVSTISFCCISNTP